MRFVYLVCVLLLAHTSDAKRKLRLSRLDSKFWFVDVNASMSNTGLMYTGFGKADSSGKAWSLAFGFPLYKETYGNPYYNQQHYNLGLSSSYVFKSLYRRKSSSLNFGINLIMSRCKEDVMNTAYRKGDSIYFYNYFRLNATRLNLVPNLEYTFAINSHFYFALNAGSVVNASYLKFIDAIIGSYGQSQVVLAEAYPTKYPQNGWNTSVSLYYGLKLIYQLRK